MAWSFVSPGSRGIGFALTRHLLRTTEVPVVTTARSDLDGIKKSILDDLPNVDSNRLTVLQLDVTDETSISAAAARAKALFPPPNHHLRLSFCVPGILHPEKSPSQIDAEKALETLKVNTLGPLLLIKHFYAFLPRKSTSMAGRGADGAQEANGLPRHAVWATMSARVGSTSDNSLGGWYGYRASKAGVNSLTKTFDLWLRATAGEKAMAVALHPGTVRTALSKDFWAGVKKEMLFTPEFAAERLLAVVKELGVKEGRGRCWDWKGDEILP